MIMETDMLKDKSILIVDDEPDILKVLEDLLRMCHITKASTFEEAKAALDSKDMDMAILDIMGVDGYRLLEIATAKKVIAVMLTAKALSPADTVKSFKKGAAYYVPKEKMVYIATYLNDILEAEKHGKNFWERWRERFEAYYDEKFGKDWRSSDKEFWDRFPGAF
jgi:DNA-binding NtrC family response regulator